MDEEQPAPPPAAEEEPEHPVAVISAQSALRLVLALLAAWTLVSGLALTFFQDASAATIGGGLEGDQSEAAKRLVGVHLLVLAPIYGLLAWELRRFRLLLWVPYVAQGGVVLATIYDMVRFDRDFADAALPLIVAATFFALLVYVWLMGRRPGPANEEPTAEELEARSTEPGGPEST